VTLTYVIVVLVVVVILYASFRTLGGGEPVAAEDYRTVLGRLAEFAATRAEDLRGALADPSEKTAEAAGGARKKLGGYLQQLSRIDVTASDEERAALDAARIQLEGAIEDLGWACRMVEAGVYAGNTGIQEAVATLQAHGESGLAAVRSLVAGAPDAVAPQAQRRK